MSNALQVVNNKDVAIHEQHNRESNLKKLLKDTFAKGATDDELALFTQVCLQQNLDPIKKQIYFMKIFDGNLKREVFTPAVSIDGLRSKAEETGLYAGQTVPLFCGRDGIWKEIWFDKEPPVACKVGIYRKDFKEPLYVVGMWDAFAKKKKEGGYTKFWAEMGPLMLAKCTEALGLRKAFPAKLSGLYTSEELDKGTIDVEHVKEQEKPKEPDLISLFNEKCPIYIQQIDELSNAELGKMSVDGNFSETFKTDVFKYIREEFYRTKGNIELENLFWKKIAGSRISALSAMYLEKTSLTPAKIGEIKKKVFHSFMADKTTNLEELIGAHVPF
jgi:phage recombination protein Bet